MYTLLPHDLDIKEEFCLRLIPIMKTDGFKALMQLSFKAKADIHEFLSDMEKTKTIEDVRFLQGQIEILDALLYLGEEIGRHLEGMRRKRTEQGGR